MLLQAVVCMYGATSGRLECCCRLLDDAARQFDQAQVAGQGTGSVAAEQADIVLQHIQHFGEALSICACLLDVVVATSKELGQKETDLDHLIVVITVSAQ